MLKQILDWWASSIIFLKFTKNWCVNSYTNILILLYHHNNLVFLKDTVSSIVLWLGWRNSKNEVSGGDSFGDFFTDLSKAFDNNLLIIELSWYAVRTKSLNLIFYLRNWMIHSVNNDRTNNSNNKNCEIIMYGPVLGPLLFSIGLIDVFLEYEDCIGSFADDTTPYSCAEDITSLMTQLQRIRKNFFQLVWKHIVWTTPYV